MKSLSRSLIFVLLVAAGLGLLLRDTKPAPETVVRYRAMQMFASGRAQGSTGPGPIAGRETGSFQGKSAFPVVVDMQHVPSRAATQDPIKKQYEAGEIDLDVNEGPVSPAIFEQMQEASQKQEVDVTLQNLQVEAGSGLPLAGESFKTIDYTQSLQGVPADPDVIVGRDQVVVGVNSSFQIFDKSGNNLVGPILYKDFWEGLCGTGNGVHMFDPYSAYDEAAGRYVLGITAYDPNLNDGDNGFACIAVSQTDDATGSWYLYSFDANPGGGFDYFLDFPQIGVGQDALYLSANMFSRFWGFVSSDVWAFDKEDMYAGQPVNWVRIVGDGAHATLQPAKLRGAATGGWPTDPDEPHYFVDAQFGNNQNTLTVWQFSDPWGNPSLTQAGTVSVNSYYQPVDQPQQGGSDIRGNDNRLLDVEYWDGRLWATHTVGCNPGSGTVNCIRWYEIDVSSGTPSLLQQGTFASNDGYRSFGDLAVNACGDMLVGYAKTGSSIYPGVYVAGREAGDAAGQLKGETLVKAGEIDYASFDPVPHRWGDYTSMVLDPDGLTFWYAGKYAQDNGADARWSTWVGSFTWPDCQSESEENPLLYVSSSSPGTVDGVSFDDEDVLLYDGESESWSLYFDGSDVGITEDVNALAVRNQTSLLLSFANPVTLTNMFGAPFAVDDSDVVQFFASSTGEDTSGYFELYLRGADVGLDPDSLGEDIDAIALTEEGALVISTIGSFRVPGAAGELRGKDEDLLLLDAGSNTFSLYFDGSEAAAGLGDTGSEDVWGSWIDANGNIYLTTQGDFVVPGLAGDGADIIACMPDANGACDYSMYWDGSTYGFGSEVIDGFAVSLSRPASNLLYTSSSTNGSVGGISFADEDVLAFDQDGETWSLYFDGSDVGVKGDVDGLDVLDETSMLMSFSIPLTLTNVSGVPFAVDDSDVVQFFAQTTGEETSGYFALYLRGADVGLTTNAEDIDAVTLNKDGQLLVSVIGGFSVPGAAGELRGKDEDLLLVDTGSHALSLYFDGSDAAVGLGDTGDEDVWGSWVDADGNIYLTTQGAFNVPGLTGSGADIFLCAPGSIGDETVCDFSPYWRGADYGFGSEVVDAFAVMSD